MKKHYAALALVTAAPILAQTPPAASVVPTPRIQPAPPVAPGGAPNNPPVVTAPPAVGQTFSRPVIGGPPSDMVAVDPASSAARSQAVDSPNAIVTPGTVNPFGNPLAPPGTTPSGFPPGPVQVPRNIFAGPSAGSGTNLAGALSTNYSVNFPPGATVITNQQSVVQPVPAIPPQPVIPGAIGSPGAIQQATGSGAIPPRVTSGSTAGPTVPRPVNPAGTAGPVVPRPQNGGGTAGPTVPH